MILFGTTAILLRNVIKNVIWKGILSQRKDNNLSESMTYELFCGSLCLLEFSILIANNTNCMDIFALVAATDLMPQYHYVVDEKCATSLSIMDLHPNQILPSSCVRIERLTQNMLPYSSTRRKRQFKIQMYFVPWLCKRNLSMKGTDDINREEVKSSYYFNDSSISFMQQ